MVEIRRKLYYRRECLMNIARDHTTGCSCCYCLDAELRFRDFLASGPMSLDSVLVSLRRNQRGFSPGYLLASDPCSSEG